MALDKTWIGLFGIVETWTSVPSMPIEIVSIRMAANGCVYRRALPLVFMGGHD